MRIEISEILRFFEVEDCIKLLRFLRIYPQKTSKFEVRMRSIVLRFFKDSSKFLKIPQKIHPKGAFIDSIDIF